MLKLCGFHISNYHNKVRIALLEKGVAFEEINVSGDSSLREKMIELSGGRRTVPEIFINGKIVGGYDELRVLDAEGKLDPLLSEPG